MIAICALGRRERVGLKRGIPVASRLTHGSVDTPWRRNGWSFSRDKRRKSVSIQAFTKKSSNATMMKSPSPLDRRVLPQKFCPGFYHGFYVQL